MKHDPTQTTTATHPSQADMLKEAQRDNLVMLAELIAKRDGLRLLRRQTMDVPKTATRL